MLEQESQLLRLKCPGEMSLSLERRGIGQFLTPSPQHATAGEPSPADYFARESCLSPSSGGTEGILQKRIPEFVKLRDLLFLIA
jgi:hypothetical protein